LKKISKDFIYNFAIKRNDEYCIEDPKIWLEENAFPLREEMKFQAKYFLLFFIWFCTTFLLFSLFIKIQLIKTKNDKNILGQK
jgi:hypothetical protein